MKNYSEVIINKDNYKDIICNLDEELGSIIISTPFNKRDLTQPYKFDEGDREYIDYINDLVNKASQKLKKGGILFVYGLPRWLPYFAVNLNNSEEMNFKYWIALDIGNEKKINGFSCNHIGMLMYVKGKNSPFHLNTDVVRVPYVACSACEKNIKDWGGKKHLINKLGSALSDVWKDYYRVVDLVDDQFVDGLKLNKIDIKQKVVELNDNRIPSVVLERVLSLVDNGDKIIHILCEDKFESNYYKNSVFLDTDANINKSLNGPDCDIYLGDSIEIMKQWVEKYPEGCFDLVFADPPYNLDKDYVDYDDTEADEDYISWCNEWLTLCVKLLKPNGNMVILNLPKWAVYHAEILNKYLYFQNWIVWDALSTPKGKIMPAHYAMLYYTKSPTDWKFNEGDLTEIDSPEYCLRASCIKKRKKAGIDNKVLLSDIWTDIHRIKHKRDRDNHPCQLPEKLMERIIELFSNKGDYVFDPFSGAGTTPVIAKKLGRKYAAIDISEEYVNIGKQKIKQLEEVGELVKVTAKKKKRKVTKKQIELYIQELCLKLGYKPSEEEFVDILNKDSNAEFSIDDIIELYGDLKSALKSGRIVLKQKNI